MAKFEAKLRRIFIERMLKEIRKRNRQLLEDLQTNVGRALQRGGLLIEARAKEILTEKGHIVTGNLRRSINTQIIRTGGDRLFVEVGSFLFYAPFIEALPDGGFLFPAAQQQFPAVMKLLVVEGIKPALIRWER
jgi:hypothetical protein